MYINYIKCSYLLLNLGTSCINCFKCSSLNGSNIDCEDPFNPTMSTYIEKCMVPKRGHVGVFPANFCTKIIGRNGKLSIEFILCYMFYSNDSIHHIFKLFI